MQISSTNSFYGLQDYSNYFKAQDSKPTATNEEESQNAESLNEDSKQTNANAEEKPNGEKLDEGEQQYVRELAAIDANVRAHEAAHIGAGAGVVSGGASFGYTRGPDGKLYATSGEVPISMKEGRTPEETIQNARQIVSAAMAPSDPSPQDYKVAASAAQMEAQARSEQAREKSKELEETKESNDSTNSTENSESQANTASQTSTESQNIPQNTSAKEKPSDEYIQYAMRSYAANARSGDSYIPRLDIAG